MHLPYMMSNSACLNGGATLFLTTLTRACEPNIKRIFSRNWVIKIKTVSDLLRLVVSLRKQMKKPCRRAVCNGNYRLTRVWRVLLSLVKTSNMTYLSGRHVRREVGKKGQAFRQIITTMYEFQICIFLAKDFDKPESECPITRRSFNTICYKPKALPSVVMTCAEAEFSEADRYCGKMYCRPQR